MILYIRQAGCNLRYNGKNYRTPIKLVVSAGERSTLINILKYKSIVDYEFIEKDKSIDKIPRDEKNIANVTQRMKKFLQVTDVKDKKLFDTQSINKRNVLTSRVVDKIEVFNGKNIKKETQSHNNEYHSTIEDEVDIDIDLSTDDILKQLLDNI